MLASFLIPFHSLRIDNVLQTIRFLKYNHNEICQESELLLLCNDRCGYIPTHFRKTSMICMKLPNMQKCKAVNEGVRRSESDVLIVLDSDRILPPGYFQDTIASLHPKTVISTHTTRRLKWMVKDQEIESDHLTYDVEKRSPLGDHFGMSVFSGNATLFKEDYWRAGGMDEEYIGYGFEDSDMSMRLRRAGVQVLYRDEVEIHLFHPRISYGKEDQKKQFLDNGIRYCRKWKIPIPGKLRKEIGQYTKELL
jgi:cellulose synthase/poly-beta-1,6-N-acetylglucosamine synthase-like glycosyltransferase